MCLCIDVSLVKKRIQNIYKRPSNFYKIVYPNITSKLQKRFFATFLPIICPVKVEAFKYIWGSTARFLCFFQESFSLPLKNYSFQWHEILDTNLDNLISDIGHINLRCFEVDILIPWHLSRSHDINIRIRIFFSLGP